MNIAFAEKHRASTPVAAAALIFASALLAGCSGGEKCSPGDLGCSCLDGTTCGRGASGAFLSCDEGRCAEAECTPGTEGCDCLPEQSCAEAFDGSPMVCRDGTCARAFCSEGTLGCPCAGGTCSAGICTGGLCVAADSAAPPAAPVCYTPCQSGLSRSDGTYVACAADGLMAWCLDGKVCAEGSCVTPGAAEPTCRSETDCPDFQTCIQGKCYSNCSTNAECSDGRKCFRHVCRAPCKASAESCASGTACVTTDGDTGYCLPIRPPTGQPQTSVRGTYSLSADSLAFSNTRLSGSITIRNDAPDGLELKVRKLDHTEYRASGPVHVNAEPLGWLSMGSGSVARVSELTLFVDGNGGTRELTFGTAANPDLARWEGRVEIDSARLGKRTVLLSYASRPEGRWAGKMYYFANFGELGLASWMANREDAGALGLVGNAFIQRWGALRQGRIPYDEFQAVVTATRTESWRWQSVRSICTDAAACYLYDKPPGYGPYSDSLEAYPIPTAVSELPIAVNLTASADGARQLQGKIVSSESLQYAGDPAFTLTFADDPGACKSGVGTACLAPLAGIDARIRTGGRYATTSGDGSCSRAAAGTFALARFPWLVPGFTGGTELDTNSGYRYRYECRDKLLPLGGGFTAENLSFAQSNPIPDGRPRVRRLELVDGALVNQESLFVIFRERFEESFLGPTDTKGFSAYGFMVLSRSPADVGAGEYQGNAVDDTRAPPEGILDTTCSPEIVSRILGAGAAVTASNVSDLARGVLDGVAPGGAEPVPLNDESLEKVHYLCHETGLFDGGPADTGPGGIKLECPAGSGVTFFTTTRTQEQIAAEPCQRSGTCQETLDLWKTNRAYGIRLNPVWRCETGSEVYCDTDRLDLRSGKEFYPASSTTAVFVPLLTAIDGAFRYKTQFRSRNGTSVGFAPEICVPDSNAIPYCYDPPAIELIRKRVDCALDLFSTRHDDLEPERRNQLKNFLTTGFGYSQDLTGSVPITYDGFERLDAELLIMLGDEAYTAAFASRFDLAGSRMVSFQGSLFEPNGMNLAGGAGNEMYSLYKAAQYYQTVLDRFYAMSPFIWQSVSAPDAGRSFITKETVVAYFDKLVRASTQKSRAWSEVSKRYQSFNRPDLARHVAERAYAAAYLESIVLSRMMLRVVDVADPADRDFIASRAQLASLGYRAALLDMREVYAAIRDEPTHFGIAPDFIPFPALEPGDVNAFTKLLNAAKQSAAHAATKEAQALASTRSYDTDSAQFQAELVRLRQSYEAQLGDLCGTFVGPDGTVHPATRTYAYLDERAKLMGDPCGFMGNGRLHGAMAQVEDVGLDMANTSLGYDDVFRQIAIEEERVETQCALTVELADYRWKQDGKTNSLSTAIAAARATQGMLDRARQDAQLFAGLTKCTMGSASDCGPAMVATTTYKLLSIGLNVAAVGLDALIVAKQHDIGEIQRETARWETLHQCDVMQVDSDARVKTLLLGLAHANVEALKGQYRLNLAYSEVQKLRNDATRLLAEQEEMEQQTINVEAARNDPNVRIYKNDAVILADETFSQAVQDAYKATRVFEYYTSQSYEKLVQLFLVRMVSHGDYNLETYLADLENAYREFQQQYGNPDTRVEIISLRDDVLAIPRLDEGGKPLCQADRITKFREKLCDASYIDERGYRTLPFSTSLARLSPLTRDHKILAVEAEIIGADVGDTLGRIYVRQRGTGMVESLAGEKSYYRLPERTAVVNPFFNGVRVFGAEVYRSDRLRDRPYVNTHWELIINQKDEAANQDINLKSLTDIRLYVYYTDFTQF